MPTMNIEDDPPLNQPLARKIFLLLFAVVLFYPRYAVQAPVIQLEASQAYFKAVSPIKVVNDTTLASITIEDDIYAGLEYKSFLKCLAFYESGYNATIGGDAGMACNNVLFDSPYCAFGYLQFWQQTWVSYCQGNIFSPRDQLVCANNLLLQNWNYRSLWTTTPFCLVSN